MGKGGIKTAAQNRKAYHDYFVEEKYEAGIELRGTEVKSIRMSTICTSPPMKRATSSTMTPTAPSVF